MKVTTLASVLAGAACAACAFGHGSMAVPKSRIYNGFLEGPESPESAAVQAAIDVGGTQPFYDWHELRNFYLGTPEQQANAPYASFIPDGQLASGGNWKYRGLDLVRSDWPATTMNAGPFEFRWTAPTPHDPSVFHAWITTPDWDPTMPLMWEHMEPLPIGPVTILPNEYRFTGVVPQRTGKHCIYVIWQRIDPAGEGFYSISDVDFGTGAGACPEDLDGTGAVDGADLSLVLAAWGTPGADLDGSGLTDGADLAAVLAAWGSCWPDCDGDGISDAEEISAGEPDCDMNGVPDACELAGGDANGNGLLDACELQGLTWTWSVQTQWPGGFVGGLTVFNGSDHMIHDWELSFGTPGWQVVNAWDCVLQSSVGGMATVTNAAWNGHLHAGESITIGFEATGAPTAPANVTLNGSPVDPG